ncbi:MAG: DUF928 domain-containing protein [Cyanobacteria bacterium P01_F01_bin.53]
MKKYKCTSMAIGLGSVVSLLAITPAAVANTSTGSLSSSATSSSAASSSVVSAVPTSHEDTLREGLPGRRLGGGTRSERIFAQNYAYLTALVTSDNMSVTAADRPTFLFYVPEMLTANQVEFVLRDANDEMIYESVFEVAPEGGVISIDTADVEEMAALAIDENYRWYFSLIPDEEDRAIDVVVYGAVRRVEPSAWLAQQGVDAAILNEPSLLPLEKARMLYQEANMWHDAALILNSLRQAEPDNAEIEAEWSRLLESAGIVTVTDTFQVSVQPDWH